MNRLNSVKLNKANEPVKVKPSKINLIVYSYKPSEPVQKIQPNKNHESFKHIN